MFSVSKGNILFRMRFKSCLQIAGCMQNRWSLILTMRIWENHVNLLKSPMVTKIYCPITSEFITCSYYMNFSDDIMNYSCTMSDMEQEQEEQECFQIIRSTPWQTMKNFFSFFLNKICYFVCRLVFQLCVSDFQAYVLNTIFKWIICRTVLYF